MDRDSLLLESPAKRQHGPFRQRSFVLILAILTAASLSFTVFFAYNSALDRPLSSRLIFENPSTSILVLNILSHVTIFCIAELTLCVLETIRWVFACGSSGTPAYTFLALSRATNLAGVFCLVLGKGPTPRKAQRDGHRLWGCQRMFFVILRIALSVLLLSDISFQSTYDEVYQFSVGNAGLSPLNTTIATNRFNFDSLATAQFWWFYSSILTDTQNVKSVQPLNCTGELCKSYFMPGMAAAILPDASEPPITAENFTNALSLIQHDAPGYQVEFSPIQLPIPTMTLSDCRLYGISYVAIQICLRNQGSSFIAAWNACPLKVSTQNSCLNTTDWRVVDSLNTQMTISERRATTVFDRSNLTIMDIVDLTDPTPTNYGPEDFFFFYDIIFATDQTQLNFSTTAQYLLLTTVASFIDLTTLSDAQATTTKLQQLLATPILVFNNAQWDPTTTTNMGKSMGLAIPSYRLVIASYTLYSFTAGGFLSFAWCVGILLFTFFAPTPNLSLFPEIDVASKVVVSESHLYRGFETYSISKLLSTLSNAGSIEIWKTLSPHNFYVRYSGTWDKRANKTRPIVITLDKGNEFLLARKAVNR